MQIKDIHIDKIVRSRRKSISIKINENAEIFVNAPNFFSNYQLHSLLMDRYEWMKKHQAKVLEQKKKEVVHTYKEGDKFYFLGELFELKNTDSNHLLIDKESKTILINPNYCVKHQLLQLYKIAAKREIINIAINISKMLDVFPKDYKISQAEKRWGSCSSKGIINLSYRLVMIPEEQIKYIVVHELSHLYEMNHSPKFWAVVEKMKPDYRENEKWFKENEYKYKII